MKTSPERGLHPLIAAPVRPPARTVTRHSLARRAPAILTAIITVLLIAIAVAYGLDWAWLAKDKDAISSLGTIVTVLVALAGGSVAYIRFFLGRTLTRRANLQIRAVLLPEPGGSGLLHSVFVDITNAGTLSLDAFDVAVCGDCRNTDGTASTVDLVRTAGSLTALSGHAAVGGSDSESIDPGECYTFLFQAVQPPTVALVTYRATLKLESGILWDQFLVQENMLPAK